MIADSDFPLSEGPTQFLWRNSLQKETTGPNKKRVDRGQSLGRGDEQEVRVIGLAEDIRCLFNGEHRMSFFGP